MAAWSHGCITGTTRGRIHKLPVPATASRLQKHNQSFRRHDTRTLLRRDVQCPGTRIATREQVLPRRFAPLQLPSAIPTKKHEARSPTRKRPLPLKSPPRPPITQDGRHCSWTSPLTLSNKARAAGGQTALPINFCRRRSLTPLTNR